MKTYRFADSKVYEPQSPESIELQRKFRRDFPAIASSNDHLTNNTKDTLAMSKSELDESERVIFNPFVPSSIHSEERWAGLIILRGSSFEMLKWIGKNIGDQIAAAKQFSHLPITGSGTGSYSFSCLFTSPIELQINELRRKADELEKSLGDKTAMVRREYT